MSANEITKGGRHYIGYEYMTIAADGRHAPLYLDCYASFGWIPDDTRHTEHLPGIVRLTLKRDRKIVNRMELTRLQRHFEACLDEVRSLERAKTRRPTMLSILAGIVGTAFMAGSVFAVTADPPRIALCILLAIPAFAGWILPYFLFLRLAKKRAKEIAPLLEQKVDEIHEICEKGSRLLP